VSEVAVPERRSTLPSPQLTETLETPPSGSAAENVRFRSCPVPTGLEILETDTLGGLSFTISLVEPEPDPAALEAVTVKVNVWAVLAPVDE